MLSVRSLKELRMACKCLLNYKNAFWAEDLDLISKWVDRSLFPSVDEKALKQELFDFLIHFKEIAGRYGFIDRNTGELLNNIYDEGATVIFKNKNFWFTGKAFYGARKRCEEAVISKGGTALENKPPDYLVVGLFDETLFREDAYSSKVEYALKLKTDRYEESCGIGISFGFDESGEYHTTHHHEKEKVLIKALPLAIISEEHWLKHL